MSKFQGSSVQHGECICVCVCVCVYDKYYSVYLNVAVRVELMFPPNNNNENTLVIM